MLRWLTLILIVSGPASAQTSNYDSANKVLPYCKAVIEQKANPSLTEVYDRGFCLGTMTTLRAMGPAFNADARFCPPERATVGQATRVVVQFMEANPQLLHEEFMWLAVQALRVTWPCPKR